jgi:serine/threonine protein kinase
LPSITGALAVDTEDRADVSEIGFNGVQDRSNVPSPSGDATREPVESPAFSMRDGAYAFLEGSSWHVLSTADSRPVDVAAVPQDVEAIILLSHPDHMCRALSITTEYNKSARPTPFIVILAYLPVDVDATTLLAAQQAFYTRGADDVVAEAACEHQMHLAVVISLGRLMHLEQVLSRNGCGDPAEQPLVPRNGGSRSHRPLSRSFEGSEQSQPELRQITTSTHDNMDDEAESNKVKFWESAHMHFSRIPELQDDLPRKPEPGIEVGPLILKQEIGRGGFSRVYVATHMDTGQQEVVKVISKFKAREFRDVRCLNLEISALCRLRHEGVVRLHRVLHGPFHLYICMEMAGKCSLYKYLRRNGKLTMKAAIASQMELIRAIAYCHHCGVAHRDIKPENIAVNSGLNLKVLDFGCAVPIGERCLSMVGTMPFMPPEVVSVDTMGYLPTGCDVWACAIVFVEMICGLNSFTQMLGWPEKVVPESRRQAQIVSFMQKPGHLESLMRTDYLVDDAMVTAYVRDALQVDPEMRPTASEVSVFMAEAISGISTTPEVERHLGG